MPMGGGMGGAGKGSMPPMGGKGMMGPRLACNWCRSGDMSSVSSWLWVKTNGTILGQVHHPF